MQNYHYLNLFVGILSLKKEKSRHGNTAKFRINEGHLEELKTISDLLGKRQVYIPVKTPTEKSVFKTVGWNYFPPEERIE